MIKLCYTNKGSDYMPQIRPVSDLRNNFAEISRTVHETAEPIFLTKNGYGDMVVMSIEAYERKLFESEIYLIAHRGEKNREVSDVSEEELVEDIKKAHNAERFRVWYVLKFPHMVKR